MNTSEPKEIVKKEEKRYFRLNNMVNIPVNGSIPLEKDKEAVKAYFLDFVNPNTVFFHSLKEKIDYLIENGYVEKEFIKKYDFEFVKKLFKNVYDKEFRFKSFMGAYKFYTQYAMKTLDNKRFLERYEDRISFTALYLAEGNDELALDIAEEMISQSIQTATPTFLNAGKARRGAMVSCFLLDVGDSMLSIGRSVNSVLQLSRLGGGIGINLSNIRASNDPIKGIEGLSSGVVPIMKIYEDSLSYSNQLGARQGAGAVYLNVFHPDIVKFLSTKKENADEKIRLKTLSLGVTIPDKYYELLKTNKPMYLFSPYDVEREYGKPFSYIDITREYDNMVANKNIKKYEYNARKLEQEISKLQQESGYPYILNIDTANNDNPVDGKIIMSNLCSEILQVQKPSEINDDLSYKKVGTDISCNLASTNVLNMINSPDFGKSVETAIRLLSSVSNKTDISEVPSIRKGNEDMNSVGLGAMGLHTALAVNKIAYGSIGALEFTDLYFRALRYHALKASNKIAKETGQTFKDFDKSAYADGSYIKSKYIDEKRAPIASSTVKELFRNIEVPNRYDWERLNEDIVKYGLYNSYLLAIAPTGSISYVNEASASIHPITQKIEHRQEAKTGAIFYPAPYLSNDTIDYYETAYDLDQRLIIDTYATAQKHVDQGMSLTLFMQSELPEGLYEWKTGKTNKMTTRDLNKLRNYAWTKGIKSIYYVRTYTKDTGGIVGANECESCSV